MFDDLTQLTSGGVLALLLIREVFTFTRGKMNGNGTGNLRPITGPPHGLKPLEKRLDKLAEAVEDLTETQAKTNRSLDDLIHSGDKSRQDLNEVQESVRYLEKMERQRE